MGLGRWECSLLAPETSSATSYLERKSFVQVVLVARMRSGVPIPPWYLLMLLVLLLVVVVVVVHGILSGYQRERGWGSGRYRFGYEQGRLALSTRASCTG